MRRAVALALAALLATSLALITARALAHPLAPIVLTVDVGDDGLAQATLKEPRVRPRGAVYTPAWPGRCALRGEPERRAVEDARLTRYSLRCGSLAGGELGIRGLDGVSGVVRIAHHGHVHQALVDDLHPTTLIPAEPAVTDVVADYAAMGMRHLFGGLDHLLFILGLMILVRGRRRLVIALTAFTLGHSITLGAAVLGLVRLPPDPIEVGIALSLVLLALRIAVPRPTSGRDGPQRPWLFAGAFGLLHGFGFAGGIARAGLPAADVPLALLGFNLGVELGQLLVVLGAALAVALARRLAPRLVEARAHEARLVPSYVIGALAVMWCFERAAQWLT